MFDHVTIRASDLAASERFYDAVLGTLGIPKTGSAGDFGDGCPEGAEWEDFSMAEGEPTTGLHIAFCAWTHEDVDMFWRTGVDAGYQSDGEPGPRREYGETYYGGFLLDPDGNSAEAVHFERERPVPDGQIDHVWIRVRDPAASKRFYTTIAPYAGLRLGTDEPGRVQMVGEDYSFSLVADERPLTEPVHLAFPARDDATVRAFHAAAIAAGYEDHGGPAERAFYHPGYYGAFVLDPDGHNVELVNHNR